MPAQDYVIDVCKNTHPEELKKTVAASIAYWTSETKKYKLISDEEAGDHLRVYASNIKDGIYTPGTSTPWDGDVILVYERSAG